MEPNSVCDHTSMIAGGIGRHEVLLQINQNYDKNVRKRLDVGYAFSLKKQQLTRLNARQQRAHDALFPLTKA